MLDKTILNSSVKFNGAASGIIQKSHDKSIFINMHNTGNLQKTMFSENPKFGEKKIVVLQVLLMSENWMMVEFVYEKDFV